MKRVSILLVLTFVFVLALSGVAYANFGPHGGYWDDTDACAGCHRAHTSFSPIRWTDRALPDVTRSALLVSSATTMSDFCATCHGDDAPGASTNVVSGVFDSGPSADNPDDQTEVDQLYTTNSSFDATLNAGGFLRIGGDTPVETSHRMEVGTIMWGFGDSVSEAVAEYPSPRTLTCTDCHNVHGSSNYRILRDELNGNVVGGYDNGVPQPFVISAEDGYPTEGWLKFEAGKLQMDDYNPNYTSPEYARQAPANEQMRSISGWCAGCHEQYNNKSSAYDYGMYESNQAYTEDFTGSPMLGLEDRHRHPVDTTLVAARGPVGVRSFTNEVVLETRDGGLPLEQDGASLNDRTTWEYEDYIGCLTCHRAHGTASTMSGWAEAELYHDPDFESMSGEDYPDGFWKPVPVIGAGGVNPTFEGAILRFDNRGVCQRCHQM